MTVYRPPEPVLLLANIFNIFIETLFIVWLNMLTLRFEIGFYISDFGGILEALDDVDMSPATQHIDVSRNI